MSEPYDKVVESVERKIYALFREAREGIQEAIDQLLEIFMPKVDISDDETKEEQKKELIAGLLTLRKKDIKAVTGKLFDVNKEAKDTINDAVPLAFAESMNHESYDIEHDVDDIGLFPVDEEDISEWLDEFPELYETKELDEDKDNKWNAKNLRNTIIAGIMIGVAKDKLGKYVTNKLIKRNRNSMVNNAYVTVSGAGEAGKVTAMFNAETKGLEMEKLWTATLDFKTRDEHRALDGNRVALDEEFAPGLRYPRDPQAPANQRCNCRCTMQKVYKGWVNTGKRRENIRHPLPGGGWEKPLVPQMTYAEWYEMKVQELGEVEIKRQVKEMKREQQKKYYRNRKRKLKQEKEGA